MNKDQSVGDYLKYDVIRRMLLYINKIASLSDGPVQLVAAHLSVRLCQLEKENPNELLNKLLTFSQMVNANPLLKSLKDELITGMNTIVYNLEKSQMIASSMQIHDIYPTLYARLNDPKDILISVLMKPESKSLYLSLMELSLVKATASPADVKDVCIYWKKIIQLQYDLFKTLADVQDYINKHT